MNKIILTVFFFSTALFAVEPAILTEDCRKPIELDEYGNCKYSINGKCLYENKDIPEDACVMTGYICYLAVEPYGAVVFRMGNDDCSRLATTSFSMTDNPNHTLWITLSDDIAEVSGLYVAAASSLVLSAANNHELVDVIYDQRKDLLPEQKNRRSVRLRSIGRKK